MTDYAIPSGEVIVYNQVSWGYHAYLAFQDQIGCYAAIHGTSGYWGYKFDNLIRVKKIRLINVNHDSTTNEAIKKFVIQGSNNASDWINLSDEISNTNILADTNFHNINNNSYFLYYRILVKSNYGGNYTTVGNIQFYGRYRNT